MGFLFSLVLCFYVIVSLCISVLILASEDGESISNSSPISPVRWTQKNSFLNYLISSLAFLFMLNCIILNRMRRYNLVNDIIMEANLAKRKEGIVDLPITEKEASKSDEEKTESDQEEVKSDQEKTESDQEEVKSNDEKVEFQPKIDEVKSEKEPEKKVDSKKSQFKKFFGFGKEKNEEKNEDKKGMEEKKAEFFSKPINTDKKTSAKSVNLDDDLDHSLENSKEWDSKDFFKEDFITTFRDLLDGNEEL